MRNIVLIIYLFSNIVWAGEIDLSTPQNTYRSCFVEQDLNEVKKFTETFLRSCVTKQGKIEQIAGLTFALMFLENSNKVLDKIFDRYGGFESLEKSIQELSTSELHKLYFDLFNAVIKSRSKDKIYKPYELLNISIKGGIAKGELGISENRNEKGIVYFGLSFGESIIFRKEGDGWLFDESE